MANTHSLRLVNTTAVILAGPGNFGRDPLPSGLPPALWPVPETPALACLVRNLQRQAVKQAVVCCNGNAKLLRESISSINPTKVKFLDHILPLGTAGCIREAAGNQADGILVALPASIIAVPAIDTLVEAHRRGQAGLTLVFNPPRANGSAHPTEAVIYVCDHSLLEHIPKQGYFDVKESLIPEMLRAGKTVQAVTLSDSVGSFGDWRGYLAALLTRLHGRLDLSPRLKLRHGHTSARVWAAANAHIHSDARICGPVVIMDGAHIAKGAVVLGPAVVGRNVTVGNNSIIADSVLWAGAQVGTDCRLQHCLVDSAATVPSGTAAEQELIAFKQPGGLQRSAMAVREAVAHVRHKLQAHPPKVRNDSPQAVQPFQIKPLALLAASVILAGFLWSYWPSLVDLWNMWQRSDEYSSGLAVPFLAAYILWSRRNSIARCPIRPCIWGVPAFLAAQGLRLFGVYDMYRSAENLSIVASIAALILLLLGWRFLRKTGTVLLFLCLMLPWPNRVQMAVSLPLQRWATASATFLLEMMGYDVLRDGNIIHIGNTSVAVAEACNGLRMVTAFFVVTGLVVLLVKRSWWEKLVVLASSLPIALVCNTVRLAITAVLFTVVAGEQWEQFSHDFGGYAMMPLALALVVGELQLFMKLTTRPEDRQVVIVKSGKRVMNKFNNSASRKVK